MKKTLEEKIRELRDEALDTMARLEQMDLDDDSKPLKKRINFPLPNIDPETSHFSRCPACGQRGSLQIKTVSIRGKTYRYPAFAHYVGTDGKTTKIRWCYLKKGRKKK